jgi:hypothetical protein
VFQGKLVGPLGKADYCNTQSIFRVYKAFPDMVLRLSEFTVDPINPRRYWSILRAEGTHTGEVCTITLASVHECLYPHHDNNMARVVAGDTISH